MFLLRRHPGSKTNCIIIRESFHAPMLLQITHLVTDPRGSRLLEDWHRALPPSTPYESDYLNMHYYKAVRLLLQPFLMILSCTDQRVALCLQASGQICQIFKRLHQRDSYGHSFIALHSVFIAGVTMWFGHD